jgi:hypothetical protein
MFYCRSSIFLFLFFFPFFQSFSLKNDQINYLSSDITKILDKVSLKSDSIPKLSKSAIIRLESMLLIQTCTKMMVEDGIKLNQTENTNKMSLNVSVSNFNNKYGYGFENTIAIAIGSNNDSLIDIDINSALWNQLSNVEKVATIYHEVCHDILNVKHIEGDVLNLMHPSAQPRNYDEAQIMYDKFIRDYKLGRVEKFSEGFFIHDRTNKIKPYLKKL